MSATRSFSIALVFPLIIGACASTAPDHPSAWGSDEVSLTVNASTTTVQLLASCGCYGSYGEISQPVPLFFFNDTATTEIYTRSLVGSVKYQNWCKAFAPSMRAASICSRSSDCSEVMK